MDIVQVFNDELQSVLRSKPSVSKAKMVQITRAAMKGVKCYKHIVQAVEKFIARSRPEYMVPGLYVIDSIVRQSRHQFGIDRDVYTARFSRNIMMTFETLFANCPPDDKPKIVRVLNLWQKNGVFDSQIVQPLMEMANTVNSSSSRMPPASPPDVDGGGGGSSSGGPISKYLSQRYGHHRNSDRGPDDGLKFNKDMLDFDYDEDDDDVGDETPTEAEPPLSSTLNKIGLDHRGHRSDSKTRLSQAAAAHRIHDLPPRKQPDHDPVLERWQRIVNQQSTSNTDTNERHTAPSYQHRDLARSRSRSPPALLPPVSSNNSSQQPKLFDQIQFKTNQVNSEQQSSKEDSLHVNQNLVSRDVERAAERERKCLPKIRDKHVTVCSATLWLGHVPKSVTEVDISDAFGEFGSISSIDLVPPRGCAYVCMDRRQDAKRALNESRDIKLKGGHIKMAWAPGKGFKEYKRLKDFWEADVGASFIPYSRIDESIDFEVLEEGGVIDEDSLSIEMRDRRERSLKDKKTNTNNNNNNESTLSQSGLSMPLAPIPILNQPQAPPPPTIIQPFTMPPPNLNVPPPMAMNQQGLIPFPPPGVTTTSSGANHVTVPPPSMILGQNSSMRDNDADNSDDPSTSIDQQLSMTERQINMVEQQLSMLQQAQSLNRGPPLPPLMQAMQPNLARQHQQPTIFQQNAQPDPMIFDMAMQQQIQMHHAQVMMDPMSMFANQVNNLMMPPNLMIPNNMSEMSDMGQNMIHNNDQSVIQID